MSDPTDFPYSPLRDALKAMFGRLGLVAAAILVGAFLGGLSSTGLLTQSLENTLMSPLLAVWSLFAGPGFVLMGFLLVFTILFTTWEWPHWTLSFAVLLMWWNIHATLS